MQQVFVLQNEKSWKTLFTDGNIIRLVNEKYTTPEEFLEKYEEKGFLKKRQELSIADIKRITYPEKDSSNAAIEFAGQSSAVELVFDNYLLRDEFVSIATKPGKLTATTGSISKFKAITPSLIGILITAFLGFVVYIDAQAIEAGEEVDTGGRRSLYKKLLAWLGELLGTTGTLVAGGAIILLCLYFIYKNLKNPPTQVIYS